MRGALRALLVPLLLGLAVLTACSTSPTGRRQLNLMSRAQEQQLGEEAFDEMIAEVRLVESGPDYEMVQRLGRRIAAAAKRLYPDSGAREFEWEFVLIDDPETVNAWALPGGKCAVYTGLLPVAQTEDALAAVVGHEVGHVIAHHGAERMSQGLALQLGMIGANYGLRNMDPGKRSTAMAALGLGATVGVMLPFSRTQESEADEIGLFLAADAGYDPRAAIGLWERMSEMGGAKPPEFLSTHPSDETRIRHLESIMPEALRLYEAAQERRREFRQRNR